jgi:hypothetical protein
MFFKLVVSDRFILLTCSRIKVFAHNDLKGGFSMKRAVTDHVTYVASWDMSLEDMIRLQQNGEFIPRTGHVGNATPFNLVQASVLGASTSVLYDRTIPARDFRANPGCVIKDGKAQAIVDYEDTRVLTPYAKFGREYQPLDGFEGKNPAHLHVTAMKRLNPRTIIFSEWIDRNRTAVELMIAHCLKERIILFNRYVDEYGAIYYFKSIRGTDHIFGSETGTIAIPEADLAHLFWRLNKGIKKRVLEGKDIAVDGVIFANWGSLMIDLLRAALDGKDAIYHSAGPDMIKYCFTKPYFKPVEEVFEPIARREGILRKLEYHIIPTYVWDFMVAEEYRGLVEEMVEKYHVMEQCNKHREHVFREATGEGRRTKGYPPCDNALLECIRAKEAFMEARKPFIDECMTHSERCTFFSQYDALTKPYYYPEALIPVSFKEIRKRIMFQA